MQRSQGSLCSIFPVSKSLFRKNLHDMKRKEKAWEKTKMDWSNCSLTLHGRSHSDVSSAVFTSRAFLREGLVL